MRRQEHTEELSRRIIDALLAESYVFSAARRTHVFAAGKVRPLAALSGLDPLVHKQLAAWLGERLRSAISPNARAFKKGDSAELAVADFSAYLQAHRAAHPDPRTRGLYVLRADVSQYGDSIPVHAQAPLWPLLDAHCERSEQAPPHDVLLRLVRRALRTPIVGIGTDGAIASQLVGLPTGSALLPVIENIYLDGLDRDLSGVSGGFYARYGDDILFAHSDPAARREAERDLGKHLSALGLFTNEKKLQRLYFTAAGRWSAADRGVMPAQYVEWLGYRISFDGTIALTVKKWKKLLGHVRQLVSGTGALLRAQGVEGERLTKALSQVLASAYDHETPLAHPYIPIAMRILTDRTQLKELDYAVALAVAEHITGRSGVRAFRKLSYKKLRRDFGLPSLVVQRNRQRTKKKRGAPAEPA